VTKKSRPLPRRKFIQDSAYGVAGLAALHLGSAFGADNSSSSTADGRWFVAKEMPIKTQELYPAVHNERLYVAGGIASQLGVPYFTNRCFSFAADTNDWREEASLPEDLHHAALASTGQDLVLAGGFNGGYTHIWRMRERVYRLRASTWEPYVSLPRPQAEGVFAASPAGNLHLATGQTPKSEANESRDDHSEARDHWVLGDGASSWESLAPVPTARNSATGGWIGDQLIVTGGRTSKGNLDVTEIYDGGEDRWRTAAPMPLPQAGTASVVVGNSLLVFGGEIFVPNAAVFSQCYRYRLDRDQWDAIPDMVTPRHGLGAGILGHAVYVVGGATKPSGRGTSDANEALLLSSILGDRTKCQVGMLGCDVRV